MFCTHLTGVIVPVTMPSLKENKVKGEAAKERWVHLTCVNWIKEIYFKESTETCDESLSPSSKLGTPAAIDFYSGTSGVIEG